MRKAEEGKREGKLQAREERRGKERRVKESEKSVTVQVHEGGEKKVREGGRELK